MIRKLFNFFFILLTFQILAQVYPVQMTPVFHVPYSSRLSDYATSMDVRMRLLVNTTDIGINNRQVRLKMYVQGNGIQAQSSEVVVGMNPIYINGGELLTLTNLELAPLFRLENLEGMSPSQYANALPEGLYTVCFELYDFLTNQKISQKSCAQLYLMLNDPPLLNTPSRNESIVVSDFPNILFTWTPRQINATNVSYQFELKEILDPTIDPQIGFLTSPLLYEEELRSTALLYDVSKPNLLPGKRYAWRVRAMSTSGLSLNNVFKNEGYSEIYHFTYASHCPAPTFILSEAVSARSVRVSWLGDKNHTKYHLQYKKAPPLGAGGLWFEVYTMNPQTTLSDLEAGVSYEFRVGGSCEPAVLGNTGTFTYSGINQFSMPAAGTSNTSFTCGLNPTIAIANQTPINNLIVSETFTAGDFPVKILELTGNNPYSGKGYIIVPYLADTKIAVAFNNITVNTNYQLIKGVVETTYNPEAPNVVEEDPLIVEVFGPQEGGQDVGVVSVNESETSGTTTEVNSGNNTSSSSNVGSTSTTGENHSNNSNTNPVGTTNETSNPTNETVSGNTNQNSTGTNVTGKDYYIEYEDKKYYTGGKIKIPYKRSMYETFEMKNLEKGTKVNFTIHEPGKETLWRGYDATTAKQSLPIEDNTPNLINLLKFDLVANAFELEKKPSVRIEIEKTLKPFVFTKLEAIDLSNTKRIAGEGETLYYVNKPTVSQETKETSFEITISPNLPTNEIPGENIKWKFNEINDENKNGVKDFNVYVNENKNVNVTGITGFPNPTSKSVNVMWVDENYNKTKLTIGTASNPFFKKALELTSLMEKISSKLDKIPFFKRMKKNENIEGKIGFYFDIIPFEEILKNEEDKNSRYYYRKRTSKGGIDIGLSGNVKETIWGLPIDKIPVIGDKIKEYISAAVYVIGTAKAGGELKGEHIEYKYVNNEQWKEISNQVNPAFIKLDVDFGVGAEVKFLKKNEYLSFAGDANGKAKAEIFTIGWKNNDFQYGFIQNGVFIDFQATFSGTFLGKKIETTPYYHRIELIKPQTN
ncbi:hypothetical protein EH230_12100 [Flavobacterium columnare]|uniref:Fibronectin type-III domain-containing protein n=1 Tax=Flavobacterium columnare TaxID=996 RepID=A0A437UDB6_9FLAO|nr:fibronectin type III domain-containing protein [Flavobacterium columnare]RVU91581.1 hypothetical protein EH230_12100 [Flavobacterium columnare]